MFHVLRGPHQRSRAAPWHPSPGASGDASDTRTVALPLPRVILIAERDQHVRALQRFFLERDGFVVEFADDGAMAAERTRAAQPAVVVTEILLPKLDGLTLCRQLRDDPSTRPIPVIVFSVLAAAARAGEAGAHAFLRKPLVESAFLAAIRDALGEATHTMEQQWASR